MATLTITVGYKQDGFVQARAIDVSDFYVQAWQPLARSDDPFLGALLGEACEAEAQVIYRLRQDAAADLARVIASALLREMAKIDTINGYKVERDGE